MEYKTKNFYLSVVMLYMGAKLKELERNPNKTGQALAFVLEGENIDFDTIEKQYYAKEIQCEPNLLFFYFKELKTRLYEI